MLLSSRVDGVTWVLLGCYCGVTQESVLLTAVSKCRSASALPVDWLDCGDLCDKKTFDKKEKEKHS